MSAAAKSTTSGDKRTYEEVYADLMAQFKAFLSANVANGTITNTGYNKAAAGNKNWMSKVDLEKLRVFWVSKTNKNCSFKVINTNSGTTEMDFIVLYEEGTVWFQLNYHIRQQ